MSLLNNVETTVLIDGKKCHFSFLSVYQSFNHHHQFEIHVDFEELDTKWMENPSKIIKLMGKNVHITMKHRQTGEENLFIGIVTNVTFSGYHGQQNNFIISGCSPTIKLDGKHTMDSFMDKPLKMVVDEAVENSGNSGEVTAKPVYSGKIDYLCQYNETCFGFLNRLSWIYGEWFYYDGTTIFFGKQDTGSPTVIEYDTEMTHFELTANLIPPKFNRYNYFVHDDKEIDWDAPDSVPGVRGYGEMALNQSKSVFTSDANLPLEALVLTAKEQNDMTKIEKSRAAGNMLVMQGCTQTCKVKIGKTVKIKLPKTMEVAKKEVDEFLVTEVTHTIDQEGHYSNRFKGILSGIENIPMSPVVPMASPQIATIKTNADDKQLGRVKVQFQWQKKAGKTTNWIRVQTPDAGNSDLVPQNRGFVFIPENNDMVMIGFEYGDPNRPFVQGSIFSEKVSIGGGIDNNLKTIITRQKHKIEFDDTEGKEKITIIDKKRNQIVINTAEDDITITANNNITLNAGETMTFNAKNMKINVKETIDTYAGENKKLFVGKNSETLIRQDYQFESENKKEYIHKDVVVRIGKLFKKICGTFKVNTTEGDLRMQASGKALMQGKEDARVSRG